MEYLGVQSAAVNVICELARKNPKNYLSLAPIFFKLMTSSTNNWMLIKIIKLVNILLIYSMLSSEGLGGYSCSGVTRNILLFMKKLPDKVPSKFENYK